MLKNDPNNAGYVVAPDLHSGYAVVALVLTPDPKMHTFLGLKYQIWGIWENISESDHYLLLKIT